MILRFDIPGQENQDIYLIEATGKIGVKVKRWSNLRPHLGKFYDRIMLRHLDYYRTEDSLTKLEKFLKEVNGKKYGLRASQLLKRDTMIPRKSSNLKPEEQATAIDDDRTFFCSELVAKCYKVCGIMQETKEACSNFFPVDFTSSSKRLKLV